MISPLVSVIIPVYNVRRYLCESIESVINQTYKKLEIILIDDGSTDGSGKICDIYQKRDTRVRVIHQKNRGLSGARNTGLDVMNGDYVAFLDSDDAYLPKMIETMVKAIKESHCDLVVCGYYVCNTTKQMDASEHSGLFKLQREVLSSKAALRYMVNGKINIPVWNKLYSSNLFDHLRFSEGRNYEDGIIIPFLFERAHKILLLDQQLLLYRIRPRSITSTYSEKNMLDWLYARKVIEKFIDTRITSVFSTEEKLRTIEKNFIHLIHDHLTLLCHGISISKKIQVIISNEIRSKLQYMKYFSTKTKTIYFIYKLNPYLCLIVSKSCEYFKILSLKFLTDFKRCFYE